MNYDSGNFVAPSGYDKADPELDRPNACPHCHLAPGPLCDNHTTQLADGLCADKPQQRYPTFLIVQNVLDVARATGCVELSTLC